MKTDKINSSQRHRARSFALQAIYQWMLSAEEVNVILLQFLATMNPKKTDINYFRELVFGVVANASALDLLLAPVLDRKLSDLGPLELAILRLATFELQNNLDIPYKVAINEAVDLAKTFAATDAHKYINGVLDKVVPELRVAECTDKIVRPKVAKKVAAVAKPTAKKIVVKPAKDKPATAKPRIKKSPHPTFSRKR